MEVSSKRCGKVKLSRAANKTNDNAPVKIGLALQVVSPDGNSQKRVSLCLLAKSLGVAPNTIRRWIATPAAHFPCGESVGRNHLFTIADVNAWLADNVSVSPRGLRGGAYYGE